MARSTIDRRPNGRYRARYVGPDRKWHSKTFDRKVDADRWLRDQLAGLDRGEWLNPQARRTTVAEFADRWLETTVHLTPKSRDSYESLLRVHVLPKFGTWRVSDVDRASVRSWLSNLQAEGLSASRTRHCRTVISRIMVTAMEAGAIKSNPAAGIKVSGGSDRDMLFLNAEQVSRLAHHAELQNPGAGTLILVLAYGGLRWGEAVGLRRGRCDLLRSRLLVKETISEVNGKLYFGSTKTHEDRVIVLPRRIAEQLAAHLAERVPEEPDALLFSNKVGNPLRNSNFRHRIWQPACKESGMPEGLRIHDMRHTAASLAVSAGANLKAVQRLLGHASATMTLDRYSHLFTDDLEALADRLDVAFSEANASYARPGGDDNVVELSA
jgi:integrase